VIFGWDASDYDHERGMRGEHIAAAAAEGIEFFAHKATEQTPTTVHQHKWFGDKLAAARSAGIPFLGAYVVARTGVPEADQAATAVGFVRSQAPFLLAEADGIRDFFWQVDLEHWDYDKVDAAVGENLAQQLEAQTGHRAVLYAPRWAYGDGLPGDRPIWNSDYRDSGAPANFREQWNRIQLGTVNRGFDPMSGRTPSILQYASDAVIGGQHTCDANVVLGNAEQFAQMLRIPPLL
jgi:GH25 family lysozyme M1 (1,4-beta-N-acetylmuramidase)